MYNFLVSFREDSWEQGVYEFGRDRVFEYTEDRIEERYRDLTPQAIDELKSFPTLFAIEGEKVPSRVGWIIDVRVKDSKVRVTFEMDRSIKAIRRGSLEKSLVLFDLGRLEMNRTHWAIKDGDLWLMLEKIGVNTSAARQPASAGRAATVHREPAPNPDKQQVFIVHGHDEIAKYEMADELKGLGCEPVILHEQASGGMTIIEKIEHYSNVGFAVVLYTPCDKALVGRAMDKMEVRARARQNVVFEHGFLIGKLGRRRVTAFVRNEVETPSDISGVVYVPMDEKGEWKKALLTEMKAAGYLPKSKKR